MIAKIVNNKIVRPPHDDIENGIFNVVNNSDWLQANGFKQMTEQQLAPYKTSAISMPKKYSTLKIIRALDQQWPQYRSKLQAANILDQFFAANYLEEDDQVFSAFMQTVPQQLKSRLVQCIWENN